MPGNSIAPSNDLNMIGETCNEREHRFLQFQNDSSDSLRDHGNKSQTLELVPQPLVSEEIECPVPGETFSAPLLFPVGKQLAPVRDAFEPALIIGPRLPILAESKPSETQIEPGGFFSRHDFECSRKTGDGI